MGEGKEEPEAVCCFWILLLIVVDNFIWPILLYRHNPKSEVARSEFRRLPTESIRLRDRRTLATLGSFRREANSHIVSLGPRLIRSSDHLRMGGLRRRPPAGVSREDRREV